MPYLNFWEIFRYINPISTGGADYAHPLGLPHLKYSEITPLFLHLNTYELKSRELKVNKCADKKIFGPIVQFFGAKVVCRIE